MSIQSQDFVLSAPKTKTNLTARLRLCAIDEWKGRKSTPLPWILFERWVPLDDTKPIESNGCSFRSYWKCRYTNCNYGFSIWSDDEYDLAQKYAMQHLMTNSHGGAFLSRDSSQGSDSTKFSQELKWVATVLRSGVPYSLMCRSEMYEYLSTNELPGVVGRHAFVERAKLISAKCMDKAKEALREQYLVCSYDCSPALDRRNFLTVNAHYVTDDLVYRKICLGIFLIDGIATGDDFSSALRQIYKEYNFQIVDWHQKYPSFDPNSHAYVVGAISDMGAGCYQASEQLHGVDGQTCCAAHGQNNIVNAAVYASPEFKKQLDVLLEASKIIREKREIRKEAKSKELPIPGNPAKERWSRYTSAVKYHLDADNKQKINSLSIFSGHEWQLKLLLAQTSIGLLKDIFGWLSHTMNILQTPGAMMAFVLPFVLALVCSKLEQLCEHLPMDYVAVGKCILIRFFRRFFYREHDNAVYQFGNNDRTRSVSIFRNIFVSAAFGLIPKNMQEIRLLRTVIDEAHLSTLREEAKESLERLHRLIDPNYPSDETTSDPKKEVTEVSIFDDSGRRATQHPVDDHDAHISLVVNDMRIHDAFVKWGSEILKESNLADARKRLLSVYGEVIADVIKHDAKAIWLKQAFRIIAAWPGTTVECERDFSWLQRILSEHRLRLSESMVSAYLIVKQNSFLVDKVLAEFTTSSCKGPKLSPGQTTITQHFGKRGSNENQKTTSTAEASIPDQTDELVTITTSDSNDITNQKIAGVQNSVDEEVQCVETWDARASDRAKRQKNTAETAVAFFRTIEGLGIDLYNEDEEAGYDLAAEREQVFKDALGDDEVYDDK